MNNYFKLNVNFVTDIIMNYTQHKVFISNSELYKQSCLINLLTCWHNQAYDNDNHNKLNTNINIISTDILLNRNKT